MMLHLYYTTLYYTMIYFKILTTYCSVQCYTIICYAMLCCNVTEKPYPVGFTTNVILLLFALLYKQTQHTLEHMTSMICYYVFYPTSFLSRLSLNGHVEVSRDVLAQHLGLGTKERGTLPLSLVQSSAHIMQYNIIQYII